MGMTQPKLEVGKKYSQISPITKQKTIFIYIGKTSGYGVYWDAPYMFLPVNDGRVQNFFESHLCLFKEHIEEPMKEEVKQIIIWATGKKYNISNLGLNPYEYITTYDNHRILRNSQELIVGIQLEELAKSKITEHRELIKNSKDVWVAHGVRDQSNQCEWMDELVGKKFATLFDTRENAAIYKLQTTLYPLIKGRLTFEELPDDQD